MDQFDVVDFKHEGQKLVLFLFIQGQTEGESHFETPNKFSRVIQVDDDYCYKIYSRYGFMENQEDQVQLLNEL